MGIHGLYQCYQLPTVHITYRLIHMGIHGWYQCYFQGKILLICSVDTWIIIDTYYPWAYQCQSYLILVGCYPLLWPITLSTSPLFNHDHPLYSHQSLPHNLYSSLWKYVMDHSATNYTITEPQICATLMHHHFHHEPSSLTKSPQIKP